MGLRFQAGELGGDERARCEALLQLLLPAESEAAGAGEQAQVQARFCVGAQEPNNFQAGGEGRGARVLCF